MKLACTLPLMFLLCTLLSGAICVMSKEEVATIKGSSGTSTSTGKRKVYEHAVLFRLKADTSDEVKETMVRELAVLKEACPQWVVAESAGLVRNPSDAGNASVGLFMRFFSAEDIDVYFHGPEKTDMSKKFIIPFLTNEITLDYEAEVDDNDNAVFRKGDEFESGAERLVGIKVKGGTSQESINTMISSLSSLNSAPELKSLLVQITVGKNFCERDQRYTHGVVVRCPSLEALEEYSKHPVYIDVLTKAVLPIIEDFVSADYIVDKSGGHKASL